MKSPVETISGVRMFHETFPIKLSRSRDLRAPPHPRAYLLREMTDLGWKVSDLAQRMAGDNLRNRTLIWHYLRHPTGAMELGSVFCNRLDEALGLPIDTFLNLERAWIAYRRNKAGDA